MLQEPVIIGNGMIAKSFQAVRFERKVVIFAAGVSNSREERRSCFKREEDTFFSALEENKDATFIYFSSTSVLSSIKNDYSLHKLKMEKMINSINGDSHVFRLPQVVGVVNNSTLVSFIAMKILKGESIDVKAKAVRNLIGLEDLVRMVRFLVDRKVSINEPVVLASNSNVSILDIVEEISSILGREATSRIHEEGDDQSVSIDFLSAFLRPGDPLLQPNYWRLVLRHYVPLIMADFCE